MTTRVEAVDRRSAQRTPDAAGFRADVQGLRAVAVGLVLLYHAGVPAFGGGYIGVDVFFVISGFLITGLIVREIEQTGRLSLARFYARRVRRLLPAAALTILGVAVLTLVALPVTRWASVAGDMVASTLYVVNWRLADRSVDYLQAGTAASPLQHFWSLAIEEQFYVVWPLLIAAGALWARRGLSRRQLVVALLAIAVPSFVWSLDLTESVAGRAYFVTTTRIWELAIGALLAIGAAQAVRLPFAARVLTGWLGIGAIVVAAITFDAETRFPGTAALVPTLGAAGVLFAGSGDGSGRLRVLEPRPFQIVGALSYSLYLWHWPVLVAAAAVWGDRTGKLNVAASLAAVACSGVVAWLAYRSVELPLHRSRVLAERPLRALAVAVICSAVGLGSAGVVVARTPQPSPEPSMRGSEGQFADAGDRGAEALGDEPTQSGAGGVVDVVESITPTPAEAADDNADVYGDGCHQNQESAEVRACIYGVATSTTRIALVGDSHAAQWQPALAIVAREMDWRLETYTKSACPFSAATVWLENDGAPYSSCSEWNRGLLQRLLEDPPDAVITSSMGQYVAVVDGERLSPHMSRDAIVDGTARVWQSVASVGSRLVVLLDTPWPGFDVPECVAGREGRLSECAFSRDEAFGRSATSTQRMVLAKVEDAAAVDVTEYICPGHMCPAVVGGVLVYRDHHHLTRTYAQTLAGVLAERLRGAVD